MYIINYKWFLYSCEYKTLSVKVGTYAHIIHALYRYSIHTWNDVFSICTSGDMLHINMVTRMPPLQSTHLPWHLNGICSSLLHEHGVSFCSWICMGTSVLKREAVTLGKQQAGFLGLSSVSPGLEAGHWTVRCASRPSPSSCTYICASLEQPRLLQSPSGWLWTALLLFYCLERKFSLYLLSTGFPGVWGAMVAHSAYQAISLFLSMCHVGIPTCLQSKPCWCSYLFLCYSTKIMVF